MNRKQQDDDRILIAHVQDMVKRGAWRSYTSFLDMRQYTMLQTVLTDGCYRFFGGYADAQRGILCIHPMDAPPEDAEYPITCLTYTFPQSFQLTHRDVLGSLMAQQVQRETVGDILVAPGRVQCFVTGVTASVGLEMNRIGRVGVRVTDALPFANDYVVETRDIRGTVSTPRLDAMLRTALGQGRGACLDMIRAGLVTLNYQECVEPAKLLNTGDVFSVRGFGKFSVGEIGEPTKKGRLNVRIVKYL